MSEWDDLSRFQHARTIWWCVRHGRVCSSWNWKDWQWGAQRDWYDAPIYVLYLGPWWIEVSA